MAENVKPGNCDAQKDVFSEAERIKGGDRVENVININRCKKLSKDGAADWAVSRDGDGDDDDGDDVLPPEVA